MRKYVYNCYLDATGIGSRIQTWVDTTSCKAASWQDRLFVYLQYAWHSILHQWNQRVLEQMQVNCFKLWLKRCMIEYGKIVQYVAVLDDSRWLKRALVWSAGGGRLGRSFDFWKTRVTKSCRWENIGWEVAAQDKALWLQYTEDFVSFMQM